MSTWRHLFERGNAAAKTAAELELTRRISADVALAQATETARRSHDHVIRNVGDVLAQLKAAQLRRDHLVAEEAQIQSELNYLVRKVTEAGDDTPATQELKTSGAMTATKLRAKQDEIHTLDTLIAQMETAAEQARKAQTAADFQLQQTTQEAERLRNLKVQAALAKSVTEATMGLDTDATNGMATMDDARSKIEADYADAIGHQQVAAHSAAGQHIETQVGMMQQAGADLFAEALAAAKA